MPGGGGDSLIGGLTLKPDIGIASGAIARFNADGSVEASFGDNGITHDLGADGVIDLRVLSDGNIAGAGNSQGQSIGQAYRPLPGGERDPDFDEDGAASASRVAVVTAFAVAEDGDVLLAGLGSIVRAGERPDRSCQRDAGRRRFRRQHLRTTGASRRRCQHQRASDRRRG